MTRNFHFSFQKNINCFSFLKFIVSKNILKMECFFIISYFSMIWIILNFYLSLIIIYIIFLDFLYTDCSHSEKFIFRVVKVSLQFVGYVIGNNFHRYSKIFLIKQNFQKINQLCWEILIYERYVIVDEDEWMVRQEIF